MTAPEPTVTVPREPTDEMMKAGCAGTDRPYVMHGARVADIWYKMLAAAPQPAPSAPPTPKTTERDELEALIKGFISARVIADAILAAGWRKYAKSAPPAVTPDARDVAFQIVENTPRTTLAMVNAIASAITSRDAAQRAAGREDGVKEGMEQILKLAERLPFGDGFAKDLRAALAKTQGSGT